MPVSLVKHNDAVERKDLKKPVKKEERSLLYPPREDPYVWRDCPHIEKTNKVTEKGLVFYCGREDKYNIGRDKFNCVLCHVYKVHRKSVQPGWE